MSERELEPTGSKDFGPCECCGSNTRRVWGLVRRGGNAEAAYFVEWTLGHVEEHGTYFDLILGKWGDGATPADRYAVSLEFRRTDRGPELMVIDAGGRGVARSELVGRSLRREEVIGTDLARTVFDIIDTIWLHDARIAEVSGEAA